MNERQRDPNNSCHNSANSMKMASDLSPKKTMFILVVVVGCFAVLWPKVFYPMLVGSANQHIKPSAIDKTTGCCDVFSETDVNTIKLMSELCKSIIEKEGIGNLQGKQVISICRNEVLKTCGIDIAAVLEEQVRLGRNIKQILNEVRSLNGSLCLKYNFGISPSKLGAPHMITIKPATNLKQERSVPVRDEMVHPAFRERGRAIPHTSSQHSHSRPPPRIVEGRPGPVPGIRPAMGGAGHVVAPPKQGGSSISVIMPIYTIGIVIFFTYTLMKLIFKKQPEVASLYPSVEPDPYFRREVFESTKTSLPSRLSKEEISEKLVVNAMSALLEEVDQEIEARRKAKEYTDQDENLVNGHLHKEKHTEDNQPSVQILGMEMQTSCEGGQKWVDSEHPVPQPSSNIATQEPPTPPQEIYLEGALPAQSQLLVSDSATEAQTKIGEDPAVVLAGKMTLSVISFDNFENETEGENRENINELSTNDDTTKDHSENLYTENDVINEEPHDSFANSLVTIENFSKLINNDVESNNINVEDNLQLLNEQFDADKSSIDLKLELEEQISDIINEAQESVEHQNRDDEDSLEKYCIDDEVNLAQLGREKLHDKNDDDIKTEDLLDEDDLDDTYENDDILDDDIDNNISKDLNENSNVDVQITNNNEHLPSSTEHLYYENEDSEEGSENEELEEIEEVIYVEEDADEDEEIEPEPISANHISEE